MIKLIQYWKVIYQINTIEMLETTLKYIIKNNDKIRNLSD